MTAVEITFMCLVVFAPLLVWFVVLLVRNKDLPVSTTNNVEKDEPDYIHDPFYRHLSINVHHKRDN